MPFVPVANTLEIVVEQAISSNIHPVNVFYAKQGSASVLTQAIADAFAGLVKNAWDLSGLSVILSNLWSITNVKVTDLTTATSPSFDSNMANLTGGNASEILPTQVCGMVEWKTAKRGRSYRGRTFLAGFCEDSSAGGPLPAVVEMIEDFGEQMTTQLHTVGSPGSDQAIVSRFSGKVPNPDNLSNRRFIPQPRLAGEANVVVSSSAETVWKTQRRRAIPG